MAIDTVLVYSNIDLVQGSTLTFPYPVGRTKGSYDIGNTSHTLEWSGATLALGTNFSISFGASTATITILTDSGIPKGNRVYLSMVLAHGASNLTLSDGTHAVTNPSTILVASGTVSGTANGVGTISGLGGGGGSYTAGLGISIDGGTINNTGTIILPDAYGSANGVNIMLRPGLAGDYGSTAGYTYLQGKNIYGPASGGINKSGSGVVIKFSRVTLNDPTGVGDTGGLAIQQTNITGPNAYATSAYFDANPGRITNAGSYGLGGSFTGGGGSGSLQGGNVAWRVGAGVSGGSSGVMLFHNIGTVDPHVLDAIFSTILMSGTVTLGNVIVQSQG